MNINWKFWLSYCGTLSAFTYLFPRICLPAHNLIYDPVSLIAWILIIRGVWAIWRDIYNFWQWYSGKESKKSVDG
ncbi:hypothetical protein [Kalamiella sp. sgz302252]|uniref:hypothetical protein n=1 Tax=Pantoea sp. sgz302252 TaxID=3341827 RepID=UPI0036D436BB